MDRMINNNSISDEFLKQIVTPDKISSDEVRTLYEDMISKFTKFTKLSEQIAKTSAGTDQK
jgi:hypothetical protein